MVIKAVRSVDYFDGDAVAANGLWKNNDNAEISGSYPAKGPRLQRLQNEIADFIGFGTPFYVTLFDDSVYYKGFA